MELAAADIQTLFDSLPDVVFFVKDEAGCYSHANLTLVHRLGLKRRDDVIGRSVAELFPASLGASYAAQDRRVLVGETISNQLEVHLFPNRAPGWCVTSKQPMLVDGTVCGLVGISRDLAQPDGRHPTYERLSRVLVHMQAHYADNLRMQAMADYADLSLSQMERQFRRVFQLSPQQLLIKLRIDAAMRLLQADASIASIGQACGFADQSAFSRQFKATVGITPTDYRQLKQRRKV